MIDFKITVGGVVPAGFLMQCGKFAARVTKGSVEASGKIATIIGTLEDETQEEAYHTFRGYLASKKVHYNAVLVDTVTHASSVVYRYPSTEYNAEFEWDTNTQSPSITLEEVNTLLRTVSITEVLETLQEPPPLPPLHFKA